MSETNMVNTIFDPLPTFIVFLSRDIFFVEKLKNLW